MKILVNESSLPSELITGTVTYLRWIGVYREDNVKIVEEPVPLGDFFEYTAELLSRSYFVFWIRILTLNYEK
jgi:hypothetical protein